MIARFSLASLPVGSTRRLHHPPHDVVVVNLEGELFALEDACPHSGRSLSEGELAAGCIVCPAHGWEIDVQSGEVRTAVGAGEANPTYRVVVEGDEVRIFAR